MKKTRIIFVSAALAGALWFSSGCDGFQPFFDDTNRDPHPPVITGLEASPDRIISGDTVTGSLSYLDAGGDIEEVFMRDLNSSADIKPVAPAEEEGGDTSEVFFFPGTAGEIEWELKVTTNIAGLHRIKVWLVDSNESRSEPAFFEFTVDF